MRRSSMSLRNIIGSLLTPILGMLPIVAFLVAAFFFPYPIALLGAFVTYFLFFTINSWILKYKFPYSSYVSIAAFSLWLIFSHIKPFNTLYDNYFSIVFEVWIIFVFSVFLFFKNYFRGKILIKNEAIRDFQLIWFNSDIYVIKIAVHLGVTHLIIVLLYCLLPDIYHSKHWDKFIFFILLYIFITFHFIYEFIHLYIIRKKYLAEEWLPVVDETGTVHGKVALSISQSSGNKYLHPVIRIALIHKGMLFLKEKKSSNLGEIPELDYPFETYLKYRETLEEGITRVFKENVGTKDLPSRFVFRYVFKNIKTNRLIYLYVSNIYETTLLQLQLGKGKWWTRKQIEENLSKGFFSGCFEKEYELLSNTILQANHLMQDLDGNC
jgi:hypothetical protein